jgi:xanthine dehydrogenase accessory factor
MKFPKQLLRLGGLTLIEHVLANLRHSRLDAVVVVLGHAAPEILRRTPALAGESWREAWRRLRAGGVWEVPDAAGPPIRVAWNPRFRRGLSSSIRRARAAVPRGTAAALFARVDEPFIDSGAIDRLVSAFRASRKGLAYPTFRGQRGQPSIFAARYFSALRALRGERGGAAILRRHADDVLEVPVAHPGILRDIDSPRDLAEVLDPYARVVPGVVLIRGAGEMATGVAHVLHRSGFRVAMTERAHPLAVRRRVCFSEAVYEGTVRVEGLVARRVARPGEIDRAWRAGEIPVLVDPSARVRRLLKPDVLVDAIMAKRNLGTRRGQAGLVVALGPGFVAGRDADVVVETNRGHNLGRLIYSGRAEANTGVPAPVEGVTTARVLRAPRAGVFRARASIGSRVRAGQIVGRVGGEPVRARIDGTLRGILRDGQRVSAGLKVGDVDPRGATARYCALISDKARAIGRAVLEAILRSSPPRHGREIRLREPSRRWED